MNEKDLEVQKNIYEAAKQKFPEAVFIGEEDITGGCLKRFPERLDVETTYIFIDPCDGSNNYKNNSHDYATTIAVYKGYSPILGIVYLPMLDILITGGPQFPATINGAPIEGLRPYNADDVRLGYGLGKRKPKKTIANFMSYITHITEEHFRYGCLSVSLYRWLNGELDFYASLKEEWYKVSAWYAILSGLPQESWITNIDPPKLDFNEAFSFTVSTSTAAKVHLQPESNFVNVMKD